VNEQQMQGIDACMRQVVVQMQAQLARQSGDGGLGGDDLKHDVYGVAEGDVGAGEEELGLDVLMFQPHDHNVSGHNPARDVLFQVQCAGCSSCTPFGVDAYAQVNDLPTIKKRRTEREPQWGECDSDVHQYHRHHHQQQQQQHHHQYQQPLRHAQDRADDARSGGCSNLVEEEFARDAGNKHATTLRLEQRSGSSQCHLAWNVASKKQEQGASVSEIHRQMITQSGFDDGCAAAGWQEGRVGGPTRDSASVKGRAGWVPLQNARERLK